MKCWMLNPAVHDEQDISNAWGPWWCHAETRGKAKRALAGALGCDFHEVSIVRFPAGDDIAITDAVGLYIGLYSWVECWNCQEEVYGDGDYLDGLYRLDDEEEPHRAAVDWRGRVYCSPECAERAVAA